MSASAGGGPGAARPLPTRDGVGPSRVALPSSGPWVRLIDFLAERFAAVGREAWATRMQRGEVVDAAGDVLGPDAPFLPNRHVFYYREVLDEPRVPFDEVVLFQDEHLLVVDKPHFLSVTPSGRHLHETLVVRLKRRLGLDTLAPVHRLDRETAGLVLFSIRPDTRGRYQGIFRERTARKGYEAVAPWRPGFNAPHLHRSRLIDAEHFMQMREAPGEPNAETLIELAERAGALARYRLWPRTGLRHQLRVHMAALGMPIVNDRIYPVLQPEETPSSFDAPLQLLARSLAFIDPVTGQARAFESRQRLRWPPVHEDAPGAKG